jgi:hypothetical protein
MMEGFKQRLLEVFELLQKSLGPSLILLAFPQFLYRFKRIPVMVQLWIVRLDADVGNARGPGSSFFAPS